MPSTIWSGAISFGLVTIPIRVSSASEDHSIHFHQVHLKDMARVRTRKVCEIDGKALGQEDIGKGYQLTKEQVVPVTDEELDGMPLPTAKAIEIVAFVPAESIDPVRISDSYYLSADGAVAAKPYVLLRRALERNSKVAVAKFAWHNRERLGLLSIRGDALVLHSMKWPDEVRDPAEVAPDAADVDEGEIKRALELMDSMTTDDITGYRDEYRHALEELIEAKLEGKAPPEQADDGEQKPAQVVDLMAALNASVKKAKEGRGEDDGDHATVHEMKPRKKAASKKAPAKKTAAKKPAAKKAATRKPKSA
ncbi:Ku protein [Streptomyces sp. NBC_00338]|uniref:non-homologous end joining protein Ku n=1 Tax=Streptomyces sp. NBC_00338 TaxID=2975715 RepID=UPI00225BB226|nr:Ku protein [Streptomyces sp. NBC_00338]MCX5144646.1 Ku protein [Streptomyces sp. NBC_00338]MCX5145058.1 Ku protein [Streptomyces sp. NBC_00338]